MDEKAATLIAEAIHHLAASIFALANSNVDAEMQQQTTSFESLDDA